MVEEFRDLEGVDVIVDDLIVWGVDDDDHDRHLETLLERVEKSGLKLNREKCKFGLDSVSYVGHVLSQDGLKPSVERVKAILDMPTPKDLDELRTFLGMMTYLGKFTPNLSKLTDPLRKLTEGGVEWSWEPHHQKAVDDLKCLVTRAPVLKFYDVDKPVTLNTDASKKGYGAVIIQDERPVAYASRRVTSAEKNYAPIKNEMSAIVFGCVTFHDYIYGQQVTVETDHKPLVGIFQKEISKLSPRLQNMRLKLLRYDLKVVWKPGKEMFVADALSRSIPSDAPEQSKEEVVEVNLISSQLSVSEDKMNEFRSATSNDPVLQLLRSVTAQGWPTDRREVPTALRPYFRFRDEIVCFDGLLFRGHQIIVPSSLHSEMLSRIHESHQGIVKTKRRAREVLFWPGMNGQIEDIVEQCSLCQEFRKAQPAEPLIPHDLPDRPWAKIGTDLYYLEGDVYLILVDYYSKFLEVEKLHDETAYSVVQKMKWVFARQGTPDKLISDNARQFVCREFKEFSSRWEFEHETISPTYSQSNGQVENAVKTVKRLMKKAKRSGKDPQMALLEFCNTSLDGTDGFSPAEMLNGRLLKGRVPTATQLLKPHVVPPMRDLLKARQDKQKWYHDQHASGEMKEIQDGQAVRFMGPKGNWEYGTIENKHRMPRSYNVVTPTGRKFRRNRKHMVPEPEIDDFDVNDPVQNPNVTSGSPGPSGLQGQNANSQSQQMQAPEQQHPVIKTRSGRVVKPPVKLDL